LAVALLVLLLQQSVRFGRYLLNGHWMDSMTDWLWGDEPK